MSTEKDIPIPYENVTALEKVETPQYNEKSGESLLEIPNKRNQIRTAAILTTAIISLPLLFGYIVWSSEFLRGWFSQNFWLYPVSMLLSLATSWRYYLKNAADRAKLDFKFCCFQMIALCIMAGCTASKFPKEDWALKHS